MEFFLNLRIRFCYVIKVLQDNISIDEKMSDEKRAFLMLGIWGRSWQVNLNNVLKGINKDKPGVIKKGLKELKILHKKIEEEIEQII